MAEQEHWIEAYKEEDSRWSRKMQVRDWLILLLMLAVSATYHLVIFFFEPGLR